MLGDEDGGMVTEMEDGGAWGKMLDEWVGGCGLGGVGRGGE